MRPPPNHLQGFVDAKQPGWNMRHRFRPTPKARPTTSAPSRAGGCGRHRRGAGSASKAAESRHTWTHATSADPPATESVRRLVAAEHQKVATAIG